MKEPYLSTYKEKYRVKKMTLKIECHFFRYKTEVYVCWCRVLLTRRRRKLPSVFREPLAGSSLIFTLSLIDVLFYESAWKPFRSSNRLPHIPKRPDLPCQKSTTRQIKTEWHSRLEIPTFSKCFLPQKCLPPPNTPD